MIITEAPRRGRVWPGGLCSLGSVTGSVVHRSQLTRWETPMYPSKGGPLFHESEANPHAEVLLGEFPIHNHGVYVIDLPSLVNAIALHM